MKIYLASPFFNEKQVALVEELEGIFGAHELFSPRKEGVMTVMTPAERKAMAPQLFKSNYEHIDWCDILFAVIDDRDVGVAWELGYAFACGKFIVTFTNAGHGLNIMLGECSSAHLKGTDQARQFSVLLHTHPFESACRHFDTAESVT